MAAMDTHAHAEKPLMSWSRYRAHPAKPAPFLPMTRAEMDGARLGRLRHHPRHRRRLCRPSELRHGDHRPAAGGAGLPGRHHRPARLADAPSRSRRWASRNLFFGVTGGNMDSMVNRYTADRRLRHDDSLHARPARAASGRTAQSSSTPSAAARRSRMCRSCSAASRPRCAASPITTTGPTRCAARSWSTPRRTSCSTAMPSAPWSRSRIGSPTAKRRAISPTIRGIALLRAACPRIAPRLHADDLDAADEGAARHAGDNVVVRLPAYEQVDAGPRGLRPRLARAASGEQSRQRAAAGAAPRRPRRLAERAADSADHAGDGRRLRPALRPRAASRLWRCEDPGLGDDQASR